MVNLLYTKVLYLSRLSGGFFNKLFTPLAIIFTTIDFWVAQQPLCSSPVLACYLSSPGSPFTFRYLTNTGSPYFSCYLGISGSPTSSCYLLYPGSPSLACYLTNGFNAIIGNGYWYTGGVIPFNPVDVLNIPVYAILG